MIRPLKEEELIGDRIIISNKPRSLGRHIWWTANSRVTHIAQAQGATRERIIIIIIFRKVHIEVSPKEIHYCVNLIGFLFPLLHKRFQNQTIQVNCTQIPFFFFFFFNDSFKLFLTLKKYFLIVNQWLSSTLTQIGISHTIN